MVISCQYPHYIYVLNPESSYQDSNGDWITSNGWTLVGSCREETSGRGSLSRGEDMESFQFSSTIQLPFGSNRIVEGRQVVITNTLVDTDLISSSIDELKSEGIVRVEGRCMKFDEGRFHNRIWLN